MVKAIDMHTHIKTGEKVGKPGHKHDQGKPGQHPDEMAQMYQSLDMMAVIFDVDHETRTGVKSENADTAGWVSKYPKTFMGFGSVDPWKGKKAVDEVKRCADLGLVGMKFQQASQAFDPTNPRFFPIWEMCCRLKLPVIFHGGTTMICGGEPGGGGLVLEYCKPIPYLDQIAARYPEWKIIIAHPAWPWHDDQLALLRHKANVYMDLSGHAPKYFPPSVVHNANTLLQDKVFFGSDFPVISPKRWIEEFATLPFKDAVRPKILLDNFVKFMGMELPKA